MEDWEVRVCNGLEFSTISPVSVIAGCACLWILMFSRRQNAIGEHCVSCTLVHSAQRCTLMFAFTIWQGIDQDYAVTRLR